MILAGIRKPWKCVYSQKLLKWNPGDAPVRRDCFCTVSSNSAFVKLNPLTGWASVGRQQANLTLYQLHPTPRGEKLTPCGFPSPGELSMEPTFLGQTATFLHHLYLHIPTLQGEKFKRVPWSHSECHIRERRALVEFLAP